MTTSKTQQETIDMLSKIFEMQTELNDYVFKKNNLIDNSGDTLNMQAVFNAVNNNELWVFSHLLLFIMRVLHG